MSEPAITPKAVHLNETLSQVSGMTAKIDLPESLRTRVDEDRTLGVSDEELPPIDRFDTMFEEPEGSSTSVETTAPKVGSPTESRTTSQTRVIDSRFNIPLRLLTRPGDSQLDPGIRADYVLIKKLGQGGKGEVWLAQQTSLNREVALKQIRLDNLENASDRKLQSERHSFLFEAVVTGDLNHPNIVPIYDMGMDGDGNLLYSMKVIRGKSWDKIIRALPESDNIDILRKVAAAVAYAHSRGIVHRDLKPHNIMVGGFDEVLIVDWGSALPLRHFPESSVISNAPGRVGTPAYMAPELGGDNKLIGPQSDIYLLGAILFEIVTGHPPHPICTETGVPLTMRQLLDNVQENVIVHTAASGELLEIALTAMRTDPRDRYATVERFIDALKNFQKHAESVLIINQALKDLVKANVSNENPFSDEGEIASVAEGRTNIADVHTPYGNLVVLFERLGERFRVLLKYMARLVSEDSVQSVDNGWTAEKNRRRMELIEKKYDSELTSAEKRELEFLQQHGEQFADRTAGHRNEMLELLLLGLERKADQERRAP